MKKTLIIGTIVLFGCNTGPNSNEGYVEPVISREDFIPVLVDLHLLEAHYQRMFSRPDVYKKSLDSASYYVFEKHGITREGYQTALIQYSYSADTIFKIYEAALDTITFRIGMQ